MTTKETHLLLFAFMFSDMHEVHSSCSKLLPEVFRERKHVLTIFHYCINVIKHLDLRCLSITIPSRKKITS